MSSTTVQEVQGFYGPFSVSEKIIQKIWLRRDFYREDLRTASGKSLKILDPGRWNMNEGPDFKEARLIIDGREIVGDVEIHFQAGDWFHHGHDQNPNFKKVILHVVLYAEATEALHEQLAIESLVLMPLLERDLEEYTMEAALLDLEKINELDWFESFMARDLDARQSILLKCARDRWQQKVAFKKKRLSEVSWLRCCHESTLEVLGYARNRAVMHKIASRYSIADFSNGLDTDRVFGEFCEDWKLSGSRPANHPKLRLKQYARICEADPNWPDRLMTVLKTATAIDSVNPAEFRKAARTKELEARIADEVFQGMIGSKRLNTLLCDAIFPIADSALDTDWKYHWLHWYPGDFPSAFSRFYRQAGLVDARIPMTNGYMQGILALFATKGEALD